MSSRMRHTRSKTRMGRSHHSLKIPRLSKCGECNEWHLRHKMCDNCGKYRGHVVIDVDAQLEKKARKLKMKRRSMGLDDEPEKDEG